MNQTEDADLLARARKFDLIALADAYDRFSPGLYAYSMRLLDDPAQAEDCVAETFSRLLNALRAGEGPRQYLQAYLYRTAHNWITDQYRRQPPLPLEPQEDSLPSGVYTESSVLEALERSSVRAALQRLTAEQRQVILLKFVEDWDNDTVAAALEKPVGAIKALQHRALESLRRILKSEMSAYETAN
jgi:RNA polymerase sigma-70 factor (ECF subfamily)